MSIMYSHTSHHASLPTLESSEESDTLSHLGGLSIAEQSHLSGPHEPVYLHPRRSELMETHSGSQGIVTCL